MAAKGIAPFHWWCHAQDYAAKPWAVKKMTTLSLMKARISDDLARSDLTSQIASAISTAIAFYQDERFTFNESRTVTFSTVASQEFYTSADNANIPTLQSIDYVIVYIGSMPWELKRRTPIDLEILNQNGTMQGQPWNYAYYARSLRLGPVPDAVYSMRIGARITYAEPASDSETGNAWMIEAEAMIRSRAKYELYLHVLRNKAEAMVMKAEADEQYGYLKAKTNRLTGTGVIRPMQF